MIAMLALPLLLAAQGTNTDATEREMFEAFLAGVEEEPATDLQARSLRVLVAPTPGDITVMRFEHRKGRPHLVVKTVCGGELPRCDPGAYLRNDQRSLTPAEWKDISGLAGEYVVSPLDAADVPKGRMWVIENVVDGRRQLTVRRSLAEGFRDVVCRAYAIAKVKPLPSECAVQPGP